MTNEQVSEERLRNTLAWATARLGQLSGAEVIAGAITELLQYREWHANGRANIEYQGDVVRICQGHHEKYEPCAFVEYRRASEPTGELCPHGMPLAENICGPCSQGRPNRGAEHWLGELLAIIHCDGGHYQARHGTEKAVADAIEKWNSFPRASAVNRKSE